MSHNPFPGPQPYRASDRGRFYGRADMAHALQGSIMANRCVTVFGPSGAGKSSVVQAAVVPELMEAYEVRVVRVDGWHEAEDPSRVLATALYADLGLGEIPADISAGDAVLLAVQRGARRSTRPMLIYLDQMEQLFYPGRNVEQTETFFDFLSQLVGIALRNVHVVLSLREDYLGRFRDRLRDRRRILDHGFRVGPLTVAELTDAVCQAATAGDPPQTWSQKQMRTLMLQVRVPGQAEDDDAEAQSAYAQIVCRALFQQRAQGSDNGEAIEAEPILRRYLETTLEGLDRLKGKAQRLLEDHLVTVDGSRTLRTEKELLRVLPQDELGPCLKALEGAAILHAEEHQGSRYFEIGHDWLAKWVFEQRETRRHAEEKAEAERRHQIELQEQQEKARKARGIAFAALVALAIGSVLGIYAWNQKRIAEAERQKAQEEEQKAEFEAGEAKAERLLAGVRELEHRGHSAWAIKLLPEISNPDTRRGWVHIAKEALSKNSLQVSLIGHEGSLSTAVFSPDGKRVLTASFDRTARVWSADGEGNPVILKGHAGPINFAAFSPDGKRVLTTSDDETARVWKADGTGEAVELKGHTDDVMFGAFSPDGQRVVTASKDGTARVFAADGSGEAIELRGPVNPKDPRKRPFPLTCAMFVPDGGRVLTASEDGAVRLWQVAPGNRFEELKGHTASVSFMAISPDGQALVTTSRDRTARLWDLKTKASLATMNGHTDNVNRAAFSPDGKVLATVSHDRTVRLWNVEDKGKPIVNDKNEPIVLEGHTASVVDVSFSPDGKYIATASIDKTARLWYADGKGPSLELIGHEAPVRSVMWNNDGTSVLTAASDTSEVSLDHTAKLWSPDRMKVLRHPLHGLLIAHSASISADKKWVVSSHDDKIARLWHINGSQEIIEFKPPNGQDIEWLANATPSPNGDRIVAASFDKKARIYRLDHQGEPIVLAGHDAAVRYAAFNPEGSRVVTVADDNKARIFAADGTGSPVVLTGHEDWLTSAAWSPDGQRVVTTSLDHTARIWDATGSKPPIVLTGHGGDVFMAVFSPDGKYVVTASEDKTARIWDANSGSQLATLDGYESPVLRVCFDEGGTKLGTFSADGTIRVWKLKKNAPASNVDNTTKENTIVEGKPIVLDTQSSLLAISFMDDGKKILTVDEEGTVKERIIDVQLLIESLSKAHKDCVPAKVREDYLKESKEKARQEFEACEKKYHRTPPPPDKPTAPTADVGKGMHRVKVIVLPGDATVEVDGLPARLRDGVVEMVGKEGTRKVRVSKGEYSIDKDVKITDKGADPPIIDLTAEITPDAGGVSQDSPTYVPKELMPETFE